MAIYTEVSFEALERFLYIFDLGELKSFEPISSGIENSNYFVTLTNEREYVLTIAEDIQIDQVSFFNDLLQQAVNDRLCVPEPQRTLDGMPSAIFKGKPTWLYTRLEGTHPIHPTVEQCREIGRAIGAIHVSAKKCRYSRTNVYGIEWLEKALAATKTQLSSADAEKLHGIATRYIELEENPIDLPRGIIHGDMFRDNALFDGEQLTGLIDFYHACEDYLVQDVAITINDWCVDNSKLDPEKQAALIAGYQEYRELTAPEIQHLNQFRQFAAMRFALTRLIANQVNNPERQPAAMLALLDQSN